MKYDKIIEGVFLERPNRFIAKVLINNREETVHVKNTGRCKELLKHGAKVILEDCSHRPNRKTKYSLIAVWKGDMLVNLDSQAPNVVVYEGIERGQLEKFRNIKELRREVSFKNSRFDIYYEKDNEKGFIEVKGVTLEKEGISMFPDAPTERGRKHVLEMIDAVEEGYKGSIFFLIQMKGPKVFTTNNNMDGKFAEAIKLASKKGVGIYAYDSIVKKDSIYINKPINIKYNI